MRDSLEARSRLAAEKCVSLAPGVRRIVAGNAGLMTGPGTNTYLFGLREVAVLDPGPDDARHLDAILAAAGPAVRWIIVTHTHPDHSPLASRLAKLTGARVIGLPPPGDGRQDATFAPHHVPVDGERLQSHDFERIAPGHGGIMERGKDILAALRAHRLAREQKVLDGLRRLTVATLDDLTAVVYDDVAVERHRWARLTLEAHLIKLAREHRASERDGLWRLTQP
jgi:glyoxylase-like metal-dependent hydrolase (beta-lactamase superfamily II)